MWSGLSDGETVASQKLSVFIIYNWTEQLGDCIQLNTGGVISHIENKVAGLWYTAGSKKEGLANLGSGSI